MHIAILLSTSIPPCEGIGFYTWNLARFLKKQGHEVTLITRGDHRKTFCETIDGIPVWKVTFLPIYPFHVHLHMMFVNRLLKQLESSLDVVHLHTPLVGLPNGRTPKLVTVHTPMKSDTGSISANNPLGVLIRLQAPVSVMLENQLFQHSDRIVAVASSVAEELRAYGIAPEEVGILGNAVDTDIFFPAVHNEQPTRSYFLTAGRLAPRKGLEDLIDCAKIVTSHNPDVHFWIAGDGPLKGELQQRINAQGLTDTVRLLGHISSREKLLDLYREAIAYVHPAHYEGLPTVMLEAMACARPVVVTAVSGALDVIRDGQNGLLVPPRAPEQLAQTLLHLIADPGLGERLGAAAVETIRERYSWETVSRAYLAEYQSLVERSR